MLLSQSQALGHVNEQVSPSPYNLATSQPADGINNSVDAEETVSRHRPDPSRSY